MMTSDEATVAVSRYTIDKLVFSINDELLSLSIIDELVSFPSSTFLLQVTNDCFQQLASSLRRHLINRCKGQRI